MLNEVLKSYKKTTSADTKTEVKQEIKELEAPSSLILSAKNRGAGGEGFYLKTKICYA